MAMPVLIFLDCSFYLPNTVYPIFIVFYMLKTMFWTARYLKSTIIWSETHHMWPTLAVRFCLIQVQYLLVKNVPAYLSGLVSKGFFFVFYDLT